MIMKTVLSIMIMMIFTMIKRRRKELLVHSERESSFIAEKKGNFIAVRHVITLS